MADTSFLIQLEQRTQQVKITLANLEAERTRIEGMINALQPLVPQYDALVTAERTLLDANVELEDAPAPEPSHEQPPEAAPSGWSGYQGDQGGQQHPWNA
ncbi:MAG TPA: hypothetical protein VIH21_08170 [Dehalococcoidia bacterium]